ncbi:PREDICTED: uncharacterized protein LOC101299946 [Fragaria vesca subsp. vesca]
MAPWTAATRQVANMTRLSSPKSFPNTQAASLVQRRGLAGGAGVESRGSQRPLFSGYGHRPSPFTSRVQLEKRPPDAKPFKVDKYKGTGDPHLHLETFLSLCSSTRYTDAMACHAFQETFSDETLSWFLNLPPNSIDNFDQLRNASSTVSYSILASIEVWMPYFTSSKKKVKDSMSYCPGGNQPRNPLGSYDALMDLAVRWARSEFATFGHSNPTTTLALPAPPPKQQPQKYEHYERGHDKSKQHGSSRDNNQGRGSDSRYSGQRGRDHPYWPREQSPQQHQRHSSPPPRYEVHTTLTTTYEDIWAKHKDLIPPPPKNKYPKKPRRATRNKYCAYYDDNGHTTKMCHGLRNAIEHLMWN